MFHLKFDTQGKYDMAWHECDHVIDYGYFSTQEKAEEYINKILQVFDSYDKKYRMLSDELNKLNEELEDSEKDERQYAYDNFIIPLRDKMNKVKVSDEFKEREDYIITEIKESDLDKEPNLDMSVYIYGL